MRTHNHHSVLTSALVLTSTLFAFTSPASACDCDCGKSGKPSTAHGTTPVATDTQKPAEAPRKFPLKGVITDILPDQSALMVKHEAIPGVMKAMTMMFKVDAAVLPTLKKGNAITALMSHRDDEWRLDDVRVAAPAAPST